MTEQIFTLGALGTLLVLLAASASATKLKSSGIHLLITQDESAPAWSANSFVRRRRDVHLPKAVQVRKFHMSSQLYSRFAKVTIESEVLNKASEGSQEVTFQVQVPEVAFMSSFTMVVDGKMHKAEVLEKKVAEKRYQEAREKNQTAGQVKQEEPVDLERGMELFTVSINVAPEGTASFTLVYNELLERWKGCYKHTLVVQPGAIVNDMKISASYTERQGFAYFAYTLPGSKQKLSSSSDANKIQMTASDVSRQLVFRPTVEMQRQFDSESGIYGEFLIFYSVVGEPGGGSIIVQNEYFAHFFAPSDLDILPKNVLFIIDISGSMSGDKIRQAGEAMQKILDDLKGRTSDKFNILLFNSDVKSWKDGAVSAEAEAIEEAKGFVKTELKSGGGTNIHKALMTGVSLLVGKEGTSTCSNIIVFLTDGDPTSGVTDTGRIISDVTSSNNNRVSIYSLAFGFNLNFDFLEKISLRNSGLARRIYADSDARDQLTDFYEGISAPVLCSVVARYSPEVVETDQLTQSNFRTFFRGREIVVTGKVRTLGLSQDSSKWKAELEGTGAKGTLDFEVPAQKVQVITDSLVLDGLTEKLWAYMKIKNMLRLLEIVDSEEEKNRTRALALNMSLTYGFVTPLTSFSIVVEKDRGVPGLESMSGSSYNVKRMDSVGYPTGQVDTVRWSWGLIWILLLGWLLRP